MANLVSSPNMEPDTLNSDVSARIALLKSLELLDSGPEEAFDRITRLVSNVLGVPIALVSLLDKDRQWFKSRVGLQESETPLATSFCAHAARDHATLVVRDALTDERFATNPLVLGAPHIRFYAGVPICSMSGVPLGTLCAIDHEARDISSANLQILTDLAMLVEREIAYRESSNNARRAFQHSDRLIKESESRLKATFDQAAVGIALVGLDGRWQRVNKRLCDIVGYTEPELLRLTFQDITHPSDLQQDLELVQQLLDGEISRYSLDKRYLRKDGQSIWINLTVALIRTADNLPDYFISVIEDIQQRKETESELAAIGQELERLVQERTQALQQTNDRLAIALQQGKLAERSLASREAELRAILSNAPDAYISLDEAGRITEWNHQAEQIFGWSRSEAIGSLLHDLIVPAEQRAAHQRGMKRYLETGETTVMNNRIELNAVRRDGSQLPVEVRISAIPSERGQLFCAFLHDITERNALRSSLLRQALRDTLTGLPNRRALNELLPQAMARANRSGHALAVLFMDLDGFKAVNDQFGHQCGDALLKQFAERTANCIRRTDTFARLSGDEFVALLEGIGDRTDDLMNVAGKILAEAGRAFELDGHATSIGVSIGLSVYRPGTQTSAEALLRAADEGMYKAKAAGKGQIFRLDVADN